MKSKKKDDRWDWQIINDYPLLYDGKDKPLTESLIPFGFECGEGWKYPLRELSCKLEALNIFCYKKYGCRIIASQVKEKFGLARVYFDVVNEGNWFVRPLKRIVELLRLKLMKIDYGYKTIVDVPAKVTDEEKEYSSKEEWENAKKNNCTDAKFIERDGKYIRQYKLHHCQKVHFEPTKNKFGHWLLRHAIPFMNRCIFPFETYSHESKVICEWLYEQANAYIKEAEKECYNRCEDCGMTIGEDWSPRCQTHGWISYICKKCAQKSESDYYCNGALMHGEDIIKTKEEVDAERKKFEDEYS